MSLRMSWKYRCRDCGEYCDEPRYVEEDRGEFWGIPCTERIAYCPHCEYGEIDDADVVDKEFGDYDEVTEEDV